MLAILSILFFMAVKKNGGGPAEKLLLHLAILVNIRYTRIT